MRSAARIAAWFGRMAIPIAAFLTVAASSRASVPGSRPAADSSASPVRIMTLREGSQLSAAERQAVFREYVMTVRAALAAGAVERARDIALRATVVFAEFRRPWLHLAAARLRLKQWGPAIEAARRAGAAHDDPFPPTEVAEESRGAAAYWEGVALFETQRYAEALPLLRAAAQSAPRWAEAERAFGEAAFVSGDARAATPAYAHAFALDARIGSARDLSYYAEGLAKNGDVESGIAALQEALQRFPNESGLHAHLGELLQKEGNLAEAYYQFVLELLMQGPRGTFAPSALGATSAIIDQVRADSKNPSRHELLAVSTGLAKLDAGEAAEAVKALEHAEFLTRSPSAVLRLLLADAYQRDGKPEKARNELRRVLAREPECVPAIVSLSAVYDKLGLKQDAARVLDQARKLFPGYWRLPAEASGG